MKEKTSAKIGQKYQHSIVQNDLQKTELRTESNKTRNENIA